MTDHPDEMVVDHILLGFSILQDLGGVDAAAWVGTAVPMSASRIWSQLYCDS